MNEEIRVRFAPSPTGYLHVGSLRTALYNYLYARKTGGVFILRIEDTDQTRYVDGAVENLLRTLAAVGLDYDEGPQKNGDSQPYFQSERTEIYREYVDLLLEKGAAYPCFCTTDILETMREQQKQNGEHPRYDGRCRNLTPTEVQTRLASGEQHVIRLKVPSEGEIFFYDLVREKVTFPWDMVDDQILIKSDGFPTYHLANVIDDHLMSITHVIRGEEWLSSVPKHLLLYQYFDWKPPKMAHLPLLLNPDKSKLSKRQGDVAVEDFLLKGFLPEALVNFVALLGWHSSSDREIYSLPELEKEFSLKRITKAGAVFDQEKLKWMNAQYIRQLTITELSERAFPYLQQAGYQISDKAVLADIIAFVQDRISTLAEIPEVTAPFFKTLEFGDDDHQMISAETSQKVYRFWKENLVSVSDLSENAINEFLATTTEATGVRGKQLYFPLRLALFGNTRGPELPVIMRILGKEKTLERICLLVEK
ncbi:MAG: glutamate--tRNA ligase [Candidatus Cloacimonetes bacterium]|nr:glutamate--tRNA ligase [Candidatus Cloacimonadota bacterium]